MEHEVARSPLLRVEKLPTAVVVPFLDCLKEIRGDSLKKMSDTLSEHVFDILSHTIMEPIYNLETMDHNTLVHGFDNTNVLEMACKVDPVVAMDILLLNSSNNTTGT